ncbi:hypothetical protein CL634_04930 [bacterium]|nr:hypothetical protein [bacterium]
MKKKKVLYHSDFSLLKTGFGRVARLILSHLYHTGKYDIVHFCCGLAEGNQAFSRLPWKSYGALPENPEEARALTQDPKLAQLASYGAQRIDDVVREEKPDVYIGVQDIWGVEFAANKNWFTNSNMAIWTTLDSLPILPMAVETAKKIEHFWCWSDFATKGLNKLGYDHVKTVRGPLDSKNFYRLKEQKRLEIRKRFNIDSSTFVVGFVFRNQLRKSVPNLLEGYKKFLDDNPTMKESKLLLHTNFIEGWGIVKLADELGLNKENIVTTYYCPACNSYGIHNFEGQPRTCPFCNTEKSYNTTSIQAGTTEEQLNEIYNVMDVYCHPFTSGGQEIPIQEAKLTELITLVTNYSCGVDSCNTEAASLPLDWSEYREHGTEFIKASTDPNSIAKQLSAVYKMKPKQRAKMGKRARKWVIDNFSIERIGKQIEDFIDGCPEIDVETIYEAKSNQNPKAIIDETLTDEEWITSLYKKVLDMTVDKADKGFQYWAGEMGKGMSRRSVEDYFRGTARKELREKETLADVVDKDDEGRRILYVIPESAGDVYMATSLFRSLKEQYPEHNLYVAAMAQYQTILEGNPHIHKVIPYHELMDNINYTEGGGANEDYHKGWFDITFLSHVTVQRIPAYTHNGVDKIAFDIKY